MVVRMPLGARPRAIQTPEYPAPEPISTAAWAPTQLATKRRKAPESADTGGMPPADARSRALRRTSSSTTVSSARYAAMASACMATATPLTLARLRSGRFQPNPRGLPAVWGPSRVVDRGCRRSTPASIGWARRPSGGPHEGACVDRTTDPAHRPGRLPPAPPEPSGPDSPPTGPPDVPEPGPAVATSPDEQADQPPSGAVGRLIAAFGME